MRHAVVPSIPASPEALFRYQVVSAVRVRMIGGQPRADAVRAAAQQLWLDLERGPRVVAVRTIYRWLKAWEDGGPEALETRSRKRTETSEVLSKRFLDFLKLQHQGDPEASIPEIIRRARALGVVGSDERVDRTTAWRAARRMGLDVQRRKRSRGRDTRRFRYPHRMQFVLADGKHIRAGAGRLRRVVLFFIDNATRYGLHAVVAPTETTELFLRGFYETLCRHGWMDIVYLDQGAGFTALDTWAVFHKIPPHLVHGEARYPAAHGCIERLNRTAKAQLFRGWDKNPAIDPDCQALELRAQHFLREVYNHTPHEGLDGATPHERWSADERPLSFAEDTESLRQKFLVEDTRDVTGDHVISVDGTAYEVPRGHANTTIRYWRQVLDGQLYVLHDGQVVAIHPVDLEANAVSGRARDRGGPAETGTPPNLPSAADIAFDRDFGPITGPDGGFSDPEST